RCVPTASVPTARDSAATAAAARDRSNSFRRHSESSRATTTKPRSDSTATELFVPADHAEWTTAASAATGSDYSWSNRYSDAVRNRESNSQSVRHSADRYQSE